VCPSTTACALTSVATGEWPARHGVTGWFSYFAERELSVVPLPFQERFTGRPLVEMGLTTGEVFPVPAFQTRMAEHRQLTLLPLTISQTAYARYSRGGTHGIGYNSIAHGFDELIEHVRAAKRPTYTHLYIPDIDSRCHHFGVEHPTVGPLVAEIDAHLSRMADALAGKARIVVTADHGLIDVPPVNHISVAVGDEMLEMLRVPFSGDARMPIFHVKPGRQREFEALFEDRYGDRFALVPMGEAERMHLFGPYGFEGVARGRFGDYAGVALKPVTMHYVVPQAVTGVQKPPFVAQHAGLSPEEMWIPVIVG
jgi:predicted AlkP superfamily pyrophosphatase or phosphodiesterase